MRTHNLYSSPNIMMIKFRRGGACSTHREDEECIGKVEVWEINWETS